MMNNQTINKLYEMKIIGMAKGYEEQAVNPTVQGLAFEDRFGLLVDLEMTHRENSRMSRLLKSAKLKHNACIEDINFVASRGLDRSQISSLTNLGWISKGINLIITGPTGSGKTWLASAFGNQACRKGMKTQFYRLPLFLEDLMLSHGDGSFKKRIEQIGKLDLVILDDLGVMAMSAQNRSDLLEVIDARSGKATIITSQLPVDRWHNYLSGGNPTVADAILDRLVSCSLRIPIRSDAESMRKQQSIEFE